MHKTKFIMKWKIALSIIVVILIVATLAGVKGLQIFTMIKAGEAMASVPYTESVQFGLVTENEWDVRLKATGTVSPINGIDIRSEVDGVIESIQFTPGQKVEAGTTLICLNADAEKALLKVAKAAQKYAESDVKRKRELFAQNSIPQAELDNAEATYDAAAAEVQRQEAFLNKRTVSAPFAGVLGVRDISLGEYLRAGDTIVSLQAFDQVYVEFTLSQKFLNQIDKNYLIEVTSDASSNQIFTGKVTAINPEIDLNTRTLKAQATLDNPDGRLRPGMFVSVEVIAPQKRTVLTIPRSAILNATYGDSVFVVQPQEASEKESNIRVVRQEIVRTGEARGDFIEVISGLNAGESIVINGAFKLRDKSFVTESDLGTITPELNPNPEEK
jgi:membrane fusion protein (multidrug efflux system)